MTVFKTIKCTFIKCILSKDVIVENNWKIKFVLLKNIDNQIFFKYMLTNGFAKKIEKTPLRAIAHAKSLRKEYQDNFERQRKNEK
mgnify:CR=1 FL=1